MTVSLDQWRAVIGAFNCGSLFTTNSHSISMTGSFICFLLFCILPKCLYISLLILLYIFSFLLCNGDIEPNPGPRKSKQNSLSICHGNLNSLSAHNFAKLTQLKAYKSIYKHDFICLSETYLDSATANNMLEIEGYNLVRADHLNTIKRGGVCMYYKVSLHVQVINLPYFHEALLLEMSHNNKKVIVSVIYRSPSQNSDEFDLFLSNFEKLVIDIKNRKPYLPVVTGDFNARSSFWWSDDINTTERTKLFSQTSSDGFQQLINEPTHTQTNSSSCIYLIFTDQASMSVNSGVHASLHPNCQHQIVHASFNLHITCPHHINV